MSLGFNLGGGSSSAAQPSSTPLLGNGNYISPPPDLGLTLPVGSSQFVENVIPPLLNSTLLGQVFYSLRSAWSTDLVPLPVSGTDALPDFDFTNIQNVLRVGETFSLFTSLPKPGTVVTLPVGSSVGGATPAGNGTSTSSASASASAASASASASASAAPNLVGAVKNVLYTIPEGAAVAGKWEFFKKDPEDTTFVRAIRATSSRDSSGHFQLLNGTLLSTVSGSSQYVFWPARSTSGGQRRVVACLRASLFVPDGKNQTLTAPRLCFGSLVDSWSSILGDISNGTIRQSGSNKAFPASFKDLFRINIDVSAPLPGVPVTLSVLPVDKAALLAPRIESILDNTPDVKFSAALDVGAPVQAFINQASKAVTGLFKPSSGAAGVSKSIAGGALSVSKVLTGLLTIPIAVDVQGRQLTKTLKPLVGEDLLSNIQQIPGASNLAGSLPIGALTATIRSVADNITTLIQPASQIVKKEVLENIHGLSLNFLPKLVAAGSDVVPSKIKIQLSLNTAVLLPGFDTPLNHIIDLGSVSITLPTITVPQIAFFFHDDPYLSITGNRGILVAIDPVTYRLASSANQILTLLSDLTQLLSAVRQIFPDSVIGTVDTITGPSLDNLLTVLGTMLNFAQIAPAPFTGAGWLDIFDFSAPGRRFGGTTDNTWGASFDGEGVLPGISSILWFGLSGGRGSYRLYMELARPNRGNTLYFQGTGLNQFSGYLADRNTMSDSLRLIASQSGVALPPSTLDGVQFSGNTGVGPGDIDNSIVTIYFVKRS